MESNQEAYQIQIVLTRVTPTLNQKVEAIQGVIEMLTELTGKALP
jgi:hypothetical protein